MEQPHYIPKEFGLDNIILGPNEEILYSTWTITLLPDNEIVHYTERDDINKTSKLFTDVFILGKTYSVKMSVVTTNGPSRDTEPFIITITDNKDMIDLYPMPSVVDTPILTMPYDMNSIPNTNIKFECSKIVVTGNAVLEECNWILVDDMNKVVWSSLKDKENLSVITLKDIILSPDVVYTMYCSQKATNKDLSGCGSIVFKPTILKELDILGDLRDTFYKQPIETRLKNTPTNLINLEYELYGEDSVLLYKNNTMDTNIILPSLKMDGQYVLLEEDGYSYYTLKIRMTTASGTYGWRDFIFKPKKWSVESIRENDATRVYTNEMIPISITIDGFDASSFDLVSVKSMVGKVYEFPDGLFLMRYKRNEYGLYSYNSVDNRFVFFKRIDLLSIIGIPTAGTKHDLTVAMLPSGIVVVSVTPDADPTKSYILKYNPSTKEFSRFNNRVLDYEFHSYIDERVLLLKTGVAGAYSLSTYNIDTDILTSVATLPNELEIESSSSYHIGIDKADRKKLRVYTHTKDATTLTGKYVDIVIASDYGSAITGPIHIDLLLDSNTGNPTDLRWVFRDISLKNGKIIKIPLTPSMVADKVKLRWNISDSIFSNTESSKEIMVNQNNIALSRFDMFVFFNNGSRLLISSVSPQTSLLYGGSGWFTTDKIFYNTKELDMLILGGGGWFTLEEKTNKEENE